MLKTLIRKLIFPNSYNQSAFISYLRRKGVVVGENVSIYSPNHTSIDTRKPWMIRIGNNCKIANGVTILAHDYSVSVPRRMFGNFVGGSLPVSIGNNVFIGCKSIILMGTTIGDNSIVGAGSVVKGEFPAGVIIAGNPARVICTVKEFYKRNLDNWVDNAKKCAWAIYNNSGHIPTIEEMSDGYAWLYLDRTQEKIEDYKHFFTLSSDDYDDIVKEFLKMEPVYPSFTEFLKDCGIPTDEQ